MMVRCGLVTCLLLLAMIDVGEASENLGPECFDCRCPRNLDYQAKKFTVFLSVEMQFQCGSDGRSYMNQCLFECAQEKCSDRTRGVTIARRGHCDEL